MKNKIILVVLLFFLGCCSEQQSQAAIGQYQIWVFGFTYYSEKMPTVDGNSVSFIDAKTGRWRHMSGTKIFIDALY